MIEEGRPHDPLLHVDVVDGRAWEPQMKKQILDRLGELWDKFPALRLGQLIGNVYHSTDSGGCRLYYAEDYSLVSTLEAYYVRLAKDLNGDDEVP